MNFLLYQSCLHVFLHRILNNTPRVQILMVRFSQGTNSPDTLNIFAVMVCECMVSGITFDAITKYCIGGNN